MRKTIMKKMKINIFKLLFVHLFFLCLLISPVIASTVSLSFDSLPSEQGWTVSNFGDADESVFSVDGTQLHMDTMELSWYGNSYGGAGAYYKQTDVVNDFEPYILTVEARATAVEGAVDHAWFGLSLQFAVNNGNNSCAFAITPDRFLYLTDSGTELISSTDNDFHQYRMEGGPSGYCHFYVDGLWVGSKPARATTVNHILLGDTTNPTNSRGDIRSYIFQQCAGIPDSNGSTQAGIDQCKADPASCGIELADTNGSTKDGIEQCKADPASCGIELADTNGSTKDGIEQCKANPTSCGIELVDTNGSTKDGIEQCKANPTSCGIKLADTNGSTKDGIEQCKADPASCGIITTPATLSSNFDLHIPDIKYTPVTGSPISYWAYLILAPSQNGLMFNVSDYGVNVTSVSQLPIQTCEELSMDDYSYLESVNDEWNSFFDSSIDFNLLKQQFKTKYCNNSPVFPLATSTVLERHCYLEDTPIDIDPSTTVEDVTASAANPASLRHSGCEIRKDFEYGSVPE
jgi:hypothetical protein